MIHWTSLIRRNSKEFSFTHFVNKFLHICYSIFISDNPLRISPKIKRIIQLSENTRFGDWYLYILFIKIRLYGCELPPYQLLVFFPMCIFVLEFIRKSLNLDQVHFLPIRKDTLFKLKAQVGPFILKQRSINKEVEQLLAQIKFKVVVS